MLYPLLLCPFINKKTRYDPVTDLTAFQKQDLSLNSAANAKLIMEPYVFKDDMGSPYVSEETGRLVMAHKGRSNEKIKPLEGEYAMLRIGRVLKITQSPFVISTLIKEMPFSYGTNFEQGLGRIEVFVNIDWVR